MAGTHTRPIRSRTPLEPVPLLGPAFKGLNTEFASLVGSVDPQWALDLREAVFNNVGRVALRKGWQNQTTVAISSTNDIEQLFEALRDDGNAHLIAVTEAKIWESTNDGSTWTDRTGAVSFTGTRFMFQNFNSHVIGFAPGETPVYQTAVTNNFATITAVSGAIPVSNGVGLAAFGRLWVVEDGTSIIHYSALLDETLWATADGGGSLDVSNVWGEGNDEVMGLAAFGATFVVFGKRQILMYVDGAGSPVAVDPDNMYIVDTIEGTGLIARDTIIKIGEGDLWFLSDIGMQSIRRVIQDKINPKVDITKNIRSLMTTLVANEADPRYTVKALYNAQEQMALILFPGSERIVMLDTRIMLEDGSARAAEWRSQTHESMISRRNGDIFFGRQDGKVAKYQDYRDDSSAVSPTVYKLIFGSPNMDFSQLGGGNRIKLLKRTTLYLVGRETITVVARWGFDLRGLEYVTTLTNDYESSGGEWGLGEFGEDEWGTGRRARALVVPQSGNGKYVKVWFEITSTDVADEVSIQELTVFTKLGRIV